MIGLLTWVTIGMAAVVALLVAIIVLRRFLSDRRRQYEERERPGIEGALAEYLAAEDPEPPEMPGDRASRALLRTVSLETLGELQGRERNRLVALLEQLGIVAETAAGLESRHRRVRRAAAEALRQIDSEQAEDSLAKGLHDTDLDTSLNCAAALAGLTSSAQLPPVLALADRSAGARPGAVAAILITLGRAHPDAIGDALAAGNSIQLRRLAAAVTGELRLAAHVPQLQEALESEDDELVARASRGLGMIGDDGALFRLLELVEAADRTWFVRLAATDAVGAIGDPCAVESLERELVADGWLQRAKAARALRMLGAAGEEALRRALGSPTVEVRDQARMALER